MNPESKSNVKTQLLSDYMFALMFIRLIFVIQWMLNRSSYKTQFVRKICEEHNFIPTNWFIFKKSFLDNQVTTVL